MRILDDYSFDEVFNDSCYDLDSPDDETFDDAEIESIALSILAASDNNIAAAHTPAFPNNNPKKRRDSRKRGRRFPNCQNLVGKKEWEGFLAKVLQCVEETGACDTVQTSGPNNSWRNAFYHFYNGVARDFAFPKCGARYIQFKNKIVSAWVLLEEDKNHPCSAMGKTQYERYKLAARREETVKRALSIPNATFYITPESLISTESSTKRRKIAEDNKYLPLSPCDPKGLSSKWFKIREDIQRKLQEHETPTNERLSIVKVKSKMATRCVSKDVASDDIGLLKPLVLSTMDEGPFDSRFKKITTV